MPDSELFLTMLQFRQSPDVDECQAHGSCHHRITDWAIKELVDSMETSNSLPARASQHAAQTF
jgi:hypothetical protein